MEEVSEGFHVLEGGGTLEAGVEVYAEAFTDGETIEGKRTAKVLGIVGTYATAEQAMPPLSRKGVVAS